MGERHGSDVTDVRCLGWVVLLLALLLPRPAAAQAIVGRVLDDATGVPLAAVEVRLLTPDGRLQQRTLSDSTGLFRMRAPLPGRHVLEGSLLGYQPLRSAPLEIARNREVTLELRLSVNAVALDAIRVVAERAYGGGHLADYYRRAEWAQKSGFGKVLTRADIDRLRYPSSSSYAPGVRPVPGSPFEYVSEPRVGCRADTYVDNRRATLKDIDAAVTPENLEGVEIYVGMQVPFEFQRMPSPCAVVLYWTRPEARAGNRLTVPRIVAGLAALTAIFLLAR
jgi:hypothetical protein